MHVLIATERKSSVPGNLRQSPLDALQCLFHQRGVLQQEERPQEPPYPQFLINETQKDFQSKILAFSIVNSTDSTVTYNFSITTINTSPTQTAATFLQNS